jgi:hypothetical protein
MGAPLGNQNASKGRMWHAAIVRALEKRGGGDRVVALDELAELLLKNVATGDMQALKELGDRLDGKPAQAIEASGPDGGPIQFQKVGVATGVPD